MQPAETTVLLAQITDQIYTRSSGQTLKWESNTLLTGLSLEMVIVDVNGLRRMVVATVSDDGTYATVVTDENTFPVAGLTQLQLEVQLGMSAPFTYTVLGVQMVTVLQSL
jgi:hypothetical protein